MIRSLKQRIIESNIVLLAGLLLAIGTEGAFAQMPGMPYMPAPATITLAQNQKYFVVSIYDADYRPYTMPTEAATTAQVPAGGTSETTINIQGSIPTSGITIHIPATANGSGTLKAYTSSPITVSNDLTEANTQSHTLVLSWKAQTYTINTTAITATISAVGGTLNAKQLDINAGIGNDCLGVLMGTFSYPYNTSGAITSFQVRDIAGIPDRMFGKIDNVGVKEHNFIYVPVVAEDGKRWLNNNLGAEYNNTSSDNFAPDVQASSGTDSKAYGSLFQWGRKPDGHELMNWGQNPPGKYGCTLSPSNAPTDALFINGTPFPYDWRVNQDNTLWTTEASANNPCPSGFRVPTIAELQTLFTSAGIIDKDHAYSSKLKFPWPGGRNNYDCTQFYGQSSYVTLWSNTISGTNVQYDYAGSNTSAGNCNRSFGFPVRCIEN